ncbi:trypsin-like peptidase domain-containing protein [Dehalogenimonas sp. 4OHTPN]|uniref:Trypsin-like peptidase domain-containing protein n=1 Tax=Dehalogenimonas sp. 4OHTPN TaxID=3166643 RepID=A0AAU8G8H1_9CHLR
MEKKQGLSTIILSVAVVVAISLGSFSIFQANQHSEDAQAQISSLSSEITSLENTITGLNGQVTALSAQLSAQFSSLNQQVSGLIQASTAVPNAIAKILPSVVFIEVAFGNPSGTGGIGSGSGLIMDKAGYILTNKHVVSGAFAARVITSDRRIYDVDEIWEDDITDLAVVKITAQNLTPAVFGDPAGMKVGDTVIAIGYPLGMSPAEGGANATAGILSNLSRFFWIDNTPYYDLMEFDAAINPGNSGGALINLKGELVGINSAGLDTAQGINYAINVATAKHVYNDLVQGEVGHHPYLGIMIDDNIQVIPGEPFAAALVGAEILDLDPQGPAAKSGLRPFDVIIKFNGQTVSSASDVIRFLWRLDVNERVTIVIKRGAGELTFEFNAPKRPFNSRFI